MQTAPQQSVVETSDLDSELEELLRETLVPGIPPAQSPTPGYHLTPAVAMITEEAFYEPAEDMEDVVNKLQAIVEKLLPWLKDDISSTESSNLRTLSSDIELEDLLESEEAA